MNRLKNIIFFLFLVLSVTSARSQHGNQETLFLFTDRDYCVSGDTVWFKVKVGNQSAVNGNVVHVQLDSPDNHLISTAKVKSVKGWAGGYIAVPDSLSSGIYFISAFLNAQQNTNGLLQLNRTLFVYNRFENEIIQLPIPSRTRRRMPQQSGQEIRLSTRKSVYSPREKVQVELDFNPEFVSEVVVKAAMQDPFAAENGGVIETVAGNSVENKEFSCEQDGFVLNGKVTGKDTTSEGVIVLLSVARDIPYFDYCITDRNGNFSFFLQNATGTATIYLQTPAQYENEFSIELGGNYLSRKTKVETSMKVLTAGQSEFAESLIDGVFFRKIFNGIYHVKKEQFSMPPLFSVPFYGEPEERVIPGKFFYLPDFSEISRELLHGVQYRERDGEVTLRVLNEDQREFFDSEPLRLLNGIPVFDNTLFKSLDSEDIEYVDFVFKERLYGDLIFNGVIAVRLTDKSNSWLNGRQQIHQFEINGLQLPKNPGYARVVDAATNIPDTRSVFCWEKVEAGKSTEFEFQLSDAKGLVEIVAEGIKDDGTWLKASVIIEVK